MKKSYIAFIMLFIFLICSLSPIIMGHYVSLRIKSSTSPMKSAWPMHSHDRKHTGRSPYNTSHITGFEKWRTFTQPVECTPIIAEDGTILTQGGYQHVDQYLLAINPDGSIKWRYEANDWMRHSSPAIAEDGTTYVGCWDSKLYAVNFDGTLKWKISIGGIPGGVSLGDDGTIFTGTHEIVAVNPNGTIKWQYPTGSKVTSIPAIDDNGHIYCGSMDDYFYALYPNGTLKWKYKTGDHIKAPASIDDDGTVYVGSFDDYLYAFYPNNGTRKWKIKVGRGTETNPSIGPDGTIYVGGDELYAVNPDGTMKWTIPLGEDHQNIRSSPAISADGIIYFGTKYGETFGGDIIAANPDGTIRWRKTIAYDWVFSSPSIAEDGTVYIGSTYDIGQGYIHAFGEQVSNSAPGTPVLTGPTKTTPGRDEWYSFTTIDPERNPIHWYIDWGDGTITDWTIEYASEQQCWFSHTYLLKDTYTIKAKARDNSGLESDWGYLEIEVPYSFNYPAWQWLADHFPVLTQLIRLLTQIN